MKCQRDHFKNKKETCFNIVEYSEDNITWEINILFLRSSDRERERTTTQKQTADHVLTRAVKTEKGRLSVLGSKPAVSMLSPSLPSHTWPLALWHDGPLKPSTPDTHAALHANWLEAHALSNIHKHSEYFYMQPHTPACPSLNQHFSLYFVCITATYMRIKEN